MKNTEQSDKKPHDFTNMTQDSADMLEPTQDMVEHNEPNTENDMQYSSIERQAVELGIDDDVNRARKLSTTKIPDSNQALNNKITPLNKAKSEMKDYNVRDLGFSSQEEDSVEIKVQKTQKTIESTIEIEPQDRIESIRESFNKTDKKRYEPPKTNDFSTVFDTKENELISEYGVKEVKENLDNDTQDCVITISQDLENPYDMHLPYIDPFMSDQHFDNKASSIFQGVCPYSHDSVFYIDFSQDKIILAKLKGTQEAQKKIEIDWPDSVSVSILKVFGDILAVGSTSGGVKLYNIKKKTIVLETLEPEQDWGFVRDIFLYQQDNVSYLAVKCALNKEQTRIYSFQQYILTEEHDSLKFKVLEKESRELFTLKNSSNYRKAECRREFQWWEQFKVLNNSYLCVSVQENLTNIINVKQVCKDKEFKEPIEINTEKPLYWIYHLKLEHREKNKKILKSKSSNVAQKLAVIWKHSKMDEELEENQNHYLIIVSANGIKVKTISMTNHEAKDTYEIQVPKDFKPNDCILLETNTLVVATTEGIYTWSFKVENFVDIKFQKLNSGCCWRLVRSFCGRIIAAAGRTKYLYLYEANSMGLICKLEVGNTCDLQMTSEHVILKSSHLTKKCWLIVSLKETDLVKTHRGLVLNPRTPDIKYLLYEKQGKSAKVVGIRCEEMIWIQPMQIARYKSFKGRVCAVNMNPEDFEFEIEMMSQEESDQGCRVCSMILMDDILTWFIADGINNLIIFRQIKLGSEQQTCSIPYDTKQNFYFFGGFYLTVTKNEQHRAICTFADSRESDVSFTSQKWYLNIDFKEKTVDKVNTRDLVNMHKNTEKVETRDLVNKIMREASCAFSINNLTAMIITDKEGKDLRIGPHKIIEIGAKNLRLSPDNKNVIIERSDKTYKIAKIGKEKLEDIKNLEDSDQLKDLANVLYFGNNYFAVGQITEGLSPESYIVYRISSGKKLCQFKPGKEFSFVKYNSSPNLVNSSVQAIYDKRTNQIYDMSIATLFQLGANSFNINPDDNILLKEYQKEINSHLIPKRPVVFSLFAPALIFRKMHDLKEQESHKRQKTIEMLIFKSPFAVIRTTNATQIELRIQSTFQFLCKSHFYKSLETWLEIGGEEIDYFSDSFSPSPVALMSKELTQALVPWLKSVAKKGESQIFAHFGEPEYKSIFKLPAQTLEEILKFFTPNVNNILDYDFALAEVNRGKGTSIANYDDLFNKRDDIKKVLFSKEDEGFPVQVHCTMIKFDLRIGSKGSKQMLEILLHEAKQNPHIFENQMVQNLIRWNNKGIQNIKLFLITMFSTYLLLLLILPFTGGNDVIMIALFWVYFVSAEIIGFPRSKAEIKNYFVLRNLLRVTLMILQVSYVILNLIKPECCDQENRENYICRSIPTIYGLIILFSWFTLLRHLRHFTLFRFLVDLVEQVMRDHTIRNFLILTLLFCTAFISASYYDGLKREQMFGPFNEITVDNLTGEKLSFIQNVQFIFMGSFADFEALANYENESKLQQIIYFAFTMLIVCVVLMNLLIGILSEKLDQVLKNKKRNDFKAMCRICLDLQNLMFWKSFNSEGKDCTEHLIFASIQNYQKKKKKSSAILKPLKENIKQLESSFTAKTKHVEDQIQDVQQQLVEVNTKMDQILDCLKKKN